MPSQSHAVAAPSQNYIVFTMSGFQDDRTTDLFTVRFKGVPKKTIYGIELVNPMPGVYWAMANSLLYLQAMTTIDSSLRLVTPGPSMEIPRAAWIRCLDLQVPVGSYAPLAREVEGIEGSGARACEEKGKVVRSQHVPIDVSVYVTLVRAGLSGIVGLLRQDPHVLDGGVLEHGHEHEHGKGKGSTLDGEGDVSKLRRNGLRVLLHGSASGEVVAVLGLPTHSADSVEAAKAAGTHSQVGQRHRIDPGRDMMRELHAVAKVTWRPFDEAKDDRETFLWRVRRVDVGVEKRLFMSPGSLAARLEETVRIALSRAAMVRSTIETCAEDREKYAGIRPDAVQPCLCCECGEAIGEASAERCPLCRQGTVCSGACFKGAIYGAGHRVMCEAGFWSIEIGL